MDDIFLVGVAWVVQRVFGLREITASQSDIAAETMKKKRRTTKQQYSSEIKERNKKTKDEKNAKKAEVLAKVQKTTKGTMHKGAACTEVPEARRWWWLKTVILLSFLPISFWAVNFGSWEIPHFSFFPMN
ncbi:hypothetical protein U1Q18_021270 [Sarracenia purpurea var. burkii]